MELLQLREKEIFETLKKLAQFKFVVIGGYAANAYALPRFSLDCDILVKEADEARKIGVVLTKEGYSKKEADNYEGRFIRYEKRISSNFRVNLDILVREILDRQTNAVFSADWVFKNSALRLLKGKTIAEELKLRIINADTLIAMKSVSGRNPDIRDVFMLITKAEDFDWIRKEISERYDFAKCSEKIKKAVISKEFKDNLQGVYGYVDKKIFEKHKKKLLALLQDF